MLHRRYSILFTLLMACLSVMGQVRDIVIKDGAYYSTASLPVDTVHNQSFEKDSIYLIVPRDAQIAYPDYNHRAQLIVWQSGRPIYALPITQYDSLSYVRMLQGDTLRTIFSQQAGSLPIYGKRPIVWQHGQVTVTDSAQVLANDIYQSMAQGNYANFIVQPTEIVRDTQYILCIRDTVYKVQDIYDDTDDVDSIPSVDTIPPTPGRRIGVFSVAADKQVSFSQGNLQYTQSTQTWQFASEQYDYLGEGNLNDSQLANRIDLFGWSASGNNAPFGVSTSTDAADYAGEFVDWGVNTISGDAPNMWRTLSEREWNYLLNYRPRAAIRKAVACVNGVNGLILLPDEWVCPAGIDFVPVLGGNYNINRYYAFTWAAMEAAGAVFLPAAGRRYDKVDYIAERGYYWSATKYDNGHSHCLQFLSDKAIMSNSTRYYGRSVRLVHDTILPPPVPEYVDLGLSVKWATFNVGARAPEYYGDYFAWGETEPKEEYSWATYKWCNGTENNITKYNKSDERTILEPEDDAAHVHWGGYWRMPTKEEIQELIDSCQWERTTVNEVRGNTVTGPNGNSIFIPSAGSYNSFDNQLHSIGTTGWLYSSTRSGGTSAVEMNMGHGGATTTSCSKCLGLNIRPVYDDNSEQ